MRLMALVVTALLPTMAFAQGGTPSFAKSYRYEGPFGAVDQACVAAIAYALEKAFEGVQKVSLNAPSITELSGVNATTVTYTGVTYSTAFGKAKGSALCVFPGGTTTPSDVQMTFEDRGMPGFLKHPSASVEKDPASRRAMSYATTLAN